VWAFCGDRFVRISLDGYKCFIVRSGEVVMALLTSWRDILCYRHPRGVHYAMRTCNLTRQIYRAGETHGREDSRGNACYTPNGPAPRTQFLLELDESWRGGINESDYLYSWVVLLASGCVAGVGDLTLHSTGPAWQCRSCGPACVTLLPGILLPAAGACSSQRGHWGTPSAACER